MKYIIKKGSSRGAFIAFLGTGLLMLCLFSIELNNHLKSNTFDWVFPGDWDKFAGIFIGGFLVLRSLKFTKDIKTNYINIEANILTFRTVIYSKEVSIVINDINSTSKTKGNILIKMQDNTEYIFDLNEIKNSEDRKMIKNKLLNILQ